MTPPDYSITLALESVVWWLYATIPSLAIIIGIPIGSTILMWAMREVKGVMPS